MYYSPFFSYTANFEFEPEAERKVTYSLDIKIIDDDEVSTSSFASGEFTPNGTLFFFFFFLGPLLLSIAASLFCSQAASAFLAIRRIFQYATRALEGHVIHSVGRTATIGRLPFRGLPITLIQAVDRDIYARIKQISRTSPKKEKNWRNGESKS